jgi:hypothetical protein
VNGGVATVAVTFVIQVAVSGAGIAGPVLAHRILTKGFDASGRSNADAVVADIVAKTRVPV